MSAEATEITILAVAKHAEHGRVIVLERTKKYVLIAPVTKAFPWYGDCRKVHPIDYERQYVEEAGVELEAQCEACGATCCRTDIPDHNISRAEADWDACFDLFQCCGGSSVNKIKFTWIGGVE